MIGSPRLPARARWGPEGGLSVAVIVAVVTAAAAAALYVHGGFAVGLAPLLGVAVSFSPSSGSWPCRR